MSWFFHSGGQRIGASAFTVTESHRNKVAYNEKSKLSVQLWIRMASTGTVQTRVRLPRSLNAHGNCQEGMLRSRRNFLPRSQHKSQSTRNRRGWLAICCTHSSEQRSLREIKEAVTKFLFWFRLATIKGPVETWSVGWVNSLCLICCPRN